MRQLIKLETTGYAIASVLTTVRPSWTNLLVLDLIHSPFKQEAVISRHSPQPLSCTILFTNCILLEQSIDPHFATLYLVPPSVHPTQGLVWHFVTIPHYCKSRLLLPHIAPETYVVPTHPPTHTHCHAGPKYSYMEAMEFISKLFHSVCPERYGGIYTHFTCATDTGNVQTPAVIFNIVKDHILTQHIMDSMKDERSQGDKHSRS